jgi:hypothetical protein
MLDDTVNYTHLKGTLEDHIMTPVEPIIKSLFSQAPVLINNIGTHLPSVNHKPVAP